MLVRSFCPLGVLPAAPWACVSLQEIRHESGRLEISPILWAGLIGSPSGYPGNIWRRTGLQQPSRWLQFGGSALSPRAAAAGRGDATRQTYRPGQLQTEQDPFFNVDRSLTVTSLRALSTDRQRPVQVRKGLTISEKLLLCSYWTAPTDPGT